MRRIKFASFSGFLILALGTSKPPKTSAPTNAIKITRI
jgi:hypothetical protein